MNIKFTLITATVKVRAAGNCCQWEVNIVLVTDDYETIRLHMIQYCETGSLKTPNHGRGKRGLKANGWYANSDDGSEGPKQQVTWEKVLYHVTFLNVM